MDLRSLARSRIVLADDHKAMLAAVEMQQTTANGKCESVARNPQFRVRSLEPPSG